METNTFKGGKYRFYVCEAYTKDQNGNDRTTTTGNKKVDLKLMITNDLDCSEIIFDTFYGSDRVKQIIDSLDDKILGVNLNNLDQIIGMGGYCLAMLKTNKKKSEEKKPEESEQPTKPEEPRIRIECYLKNLKQGVDATPIVEQFKALGVTVNPTEDGIPF